VRRKLCDGCIEQMDLLASTATEILAGAAEATAWTIVESTDRKTEADTERLLALLQHVSHRVVDSGDMVCIEGMPQAEHVGDEARTTDAGSVTRNGGIPPIRRYAEMKPRRRVPKGGVRSCCVNASGCSSESRRRYGACPPSIERISVTSSALADDNRSFTS